MSDLSLVLQTILRSKTPLTAEQVAKRSKVDLVICRVYLWRLARERKVVRAGTKAAKSKDGGRPRVLYRAEKKVVIKPIPLVLAPRNS